MKRRSGAVPAAWCLACLFALAAGAVADDREMVSEIFRTALAEGRTHQLLGELCSRYPHRLSGSPESEAANRWVKTVMEERGLEVRLQEVMVPYWERGDTMVVEVAVDGRTEALSALALGGSVGTPVGGLEAPVIEVDSLEQVEALGEPGIEGRIVFFNRALDQGRVRHFEAYMGAADQRVSGAAMAGRFGAVAVLVRSLSFLDDDYPHTGGLRYEEGVRQIPAAAISVRAANRLSLLLSASPQLRVSILMNCRQREDQVSHNVIGELKGSVHPDEYITIGAHFDAWDVGEGAQDNGSGSMQSIEAVHLLQELGYEFRRSVRVVMFANEEYLVGQPFRGGQVYAEEALKKGEKHYAAIETDAGAFTPRGFGVEGPPAMVERVRSWLEYFDTDNTVHYVAEGGGGPEIWVLNELLGTPTFDLRTDTQRYLDFHHSDNDTFDKVNRRELELGTAAMASLLYLIDTHGLTEEPDAER
ncbi:MAG: M28 family peptidase [Acidobacteria bacterium]|nr:M28 family peptidase [Acidobacteriota bacterium]